MMIKKTLTIVYSSILLTYAQAQMPQDKDFDGVPDALDLCKETPFLNVVDENGCTTNILILPFETEGKNIITTLGYGFNTNEDLQSRATQKTTKLRVSYYQNTWSFTLQSGYYTDDLEEGFLDTIIRVQKRIRLQPKFALNIGAGLRLPTYHFNGNKIDGIFYSSLHYYPTETLSFFTGYNYTKIGDKPIGTIVVDGFEHQNDDDSDGTFEGVQDKHKFYLGSGYFFTDNFYINLVYSIERSKFIGEHNIQEVSSTIYYKINKNWFTTLFYKREPWDSDLHENLLFSIGYSIW